MGQPFPVKPVRIMLPFTPGANADLIGRIVAQRVSPLWGQPVLLDHRPGGSTNIGTELAARAPAIVDGVGGHVEMIFVGVSSILPSIEAGKLRPLATSSEKRLPMIPQVPTFIESGYPEMTTSVRFGLLALAATPPEIISRINTDVARVVALSAVRKRLIDDGQEPGGGSPDNFGRFIRSEITQYAKVVKAARLRVE